MGDLRRAAQIADIPPEKIYAMERTGLFATEGNWDKLTPAERAEWTDAVEEYLASRARGRDADPGRH
jgi:hypothetical protein